MTTSLARRVERLESSAGGACPICRGYGGGLHVQRPDGPPPTPCPTCSALPVVLSLRRVPERTL
jgi:hypothetical protein